MDFYQNYTYFVNGLSLANCDIYNGILIIVYTAIPLCFLQMLIRYIARCFHKSPTCLAVEKSLLAKLRKKTGYTFTNCKKALEMNNNDLSKAETWLNEQAQELGWSKATKLEGRQAQQGLIAVALREHSGAIVELNCETDFVARNETFQSMAETASSAMLNYVEKQRSHVPLTKVGLDTEQLRQVNAADGKSLADHLALMIGTVGENAVLRRAMCLKSDTGTHISGYAHPSGVQKNGVLLGRLGGLVAIRQTTKKDVDLESLGRDICQHIVGMDPKKIGSDIDKPTANIDDETCLIYQEYLLDNNLRVKDVLTENNIEIVDFKRFECGELSNSTEQPLELVETCQ